MTSVVAGESAGLGWSDDDLGAIGASHWRDLYISPEIAIAERDAIFRRTWVLVASVEEVLSGQYLAAMVAGVPIALWRDRDGVLRAFHNICPHRGILLLEGRGPIGRIVTCPYHQWSFALDGSLVRIPQPEQFPDAEAAALALRPVAVREWHGLVFVSLAPDPTDFSADVALVDRKLENHFRTPLVEVARVEYTVACNWKLLVENHVDVYHLWYLHQRSLAPYKHTSFEWEWEGLAWWSLEPLKDPSSASPGLAGLSQDERVGLGAHLLFPNVMMVTTADYFATYDASPAGPDQTRLTLRVRSTPDSDADAIVESIRSFLAEDVVACESVQVATASPWYAVGPTALRHEQPVRIFHQLLRDRLLPR